MHTPDQTARLSTAARDKARFAGMAIGALVMAILLVVWWLLTDVTGAVKPLFFPSPSEVGQAFGQVWTSLGSDALATLLRVLGSWALGSIAGVVVGLLMVRSRVTFYALTPIIEALRPIPPIALIPFVILW